MAPARSTVTEHSRCLPDSACIQMCDPFNHRRNEPQYQYMQPEHSVYHRRDTRRSRSPEYRDDHDDSFDHSRGYMHGGDRGRDDRDHDRDHDRDRGDCYRERGRSPYYDPRAPAATTTAPNPLNDAVVLFVDYVHEIKDGAERKECSVPYANDPDDSSVLHVKGWKPEMLDHVKLSLGKIGATVKLRCLLSIGDSLINEQDAESFDRAIVKKVDDTTELATAVIWLKKKRIELDNADGVILARVFERPSARAGLVGRKEARPIEVKFKELALAGKNGWNSQCDELFSSFKNPNELLADYAENKRCVKRAMGDDRWLINPYLMACPFVDCKVMMHKLNAPSRIEYIYDGSSGHLVKAHAGNVAAERLVTRLKFAKKHPRADATAIDAGSYPLVLTNEWAEANLPAGLPDSRTDFAGFRPLSDLDDVPEAFNPAIATPLERGHWLEQVRVEAAKLTLVDEKLRTALDAKEGDELPFDEFASTVPGLSAEAVTKAIFELINRGRPIDISGDERDGTIELICEATSRAETAD